jgi:hypothetical protein
MVAERKIPPQLIGDGTHAHTHTRVRIRMGSVVYRELLDESYEDNADADADAVHFVLLRARRSGSQLVVDLDQRALEYCLRYCRMYSDSWHRENTISRGGTVPAWLPYSASRLIPILEGGLLLLELDGGRGGRASQ